ncbi:alpha-xylosidase [Ruminiclostridium cellobioparum]|uniref:alpha-xylosidase n=1 Tax=Ruminiclostridium cellobioparum TaxID=29355 RepID=UPI0004889EF8|nr:alpha-xylosidase [Ruminiclostridium cellobioparum]
MKFTDGFWLKKKGVSIYSPAEVRDFVTNEKSIILYAPVTRISNRGQTLQGPMLTIEISSPSSDIIRVVSRHFIKKIIKQPEFELNYSKGFVPEILDEEGQLVLKSGKTSVRVNKKDFSISFYYEDRLLTRSGTGQMGYITTENSGAYMREQLDLSIGECVYGLGERFSAFVKNGQSIDIWNEDGGTSSEQSYKNIPFYITNRGYGVFVNHPEKVSFEVASEAVSRTQFSVPGEKLDYFVIGGSDLKEVIHNYTAMTGRPALPPAWSFGLWLTTSFTTNYDEDTVSAFVDGMAQRDIPLRVFHFDCFWMKEYEWCNFEWDREVFPDPRNMLKRLKEKGLKICVWINPYISQKSRLFEEAVENGYLLKLEDGEAWQWDLWQPGMGIVDFTNPAACKWYGDKLEALIDMGVDCFKTDFGERIPTDVVYHNGADPVKMHNFYTYLYNRAVYEVLVKRLGKEEAVLFGRSATAGSQKFPVHWGGDCVSRYESMGESLRGGLSLCMSGFGFWSHDISGFENTASPDLYKRWSAFGLLSTHSRLHGSSSYRVPWLFDGEAVDVVRYFSKLKCSIMPYLFSTACNTAETGIPAMRPMILEFDRDRACDYLDTQYMLGDSLLVAPVFNPEGRVDYYLPGGSWTNFITNQQVTGGTWQYEKHDFMSLPLMARPNSIIAAGNNENVPDYDYLDGTVLHVFEPRENEPASATIYSVKGKPKGTVQVLRNGDQVSVAVSGLKNYSIIMRNINHICDLKGAAFEANSMGSKLVPLEGAHNITFKIV